MKKPSKNERLELYQKLKDQNIEDNRSKGSHSTPGSFVQVAEKYGYTKVSVMNLLKNGVKIWRPHHEAIYRDLLIFVKRGKKNLQG